MPDFPAHASPAFAPVADSPSHFQHDRSASDFRLSLQESHTGTTPPPLISPSITPPHTPSLKAQRPDRQPKSIPVEQPPNDAESQGGPKLVEQLPEVWCEVRARIPTTTGQEMWLHLYHNTVDQKEHLAIVFGPHIRSRSLDTPRPGETEKDRLIRGAYVGTLYPGRTSSRLDQIRREAGASPMIQPGVAAAATTTSGLDLPKPASPAPSEASGSSEFDVTYPPELGPAMVRIHSECYTGETVWSARCDCGEQLDEAARLMSLPAPSAVSTPVSEIGSPPLGHTHIKPPSAGGVIIYLRQEGRGIGLLEKLKAYNLQDLGHDTMEANLMLRHPGDARSYGIATAMLLDLGLGGPQGISLLTNNPDKVRAVEGPNREVTVVQRMPMVPLAWQTGGEMGIKSPEVERYLATKIEKFKHMLSS
ncbi:hypothetical protein K431DRAFT_53244 [Polychaeton citri CBS 116435]|uniref:GTP cyclohydrolase II n=1 Tax=Polychaeton citri CBS 116435 TaxID=1314669 RepID=A0A9P4QJ23_9PEZI|nr:hypothetical protein K431DRAFT_53244 [Polychaeton citri CBS 116435]